MSIRYVALDLETEQIAKVRHSGKIHALFLAGDDWEDCIEWGEVAVSRLHTMLDNSEVKFVIQNAAFDIWVLRMNGVDIPLDRVVDTMIAAHCINPRRKVYSLESYGYEVDSPKIDYVGEMIKAGLWAGAKEDPGVYDVPFNPLMERYGKQDAKLTLQWWYDSLLHFEADTRLAEHFYHVRMPFVETLISMHGGMHINLDHALKTAGNVLASVNSLQEEFLKKYPKVVKVSWDKQALKYVPKNEVHTPSLQSPNDVASLLFEHGWKPDEYKRDTNRPITSQAVLQRLVAEPKTPNKLKELAADIVEIRSQLGILGQLMQILKLTDKRTGLLWGSWNDTGTVTTRLSSSSPNMQNLSVRHRVWGKEVRKCFTPPPGYVMLVGDLSQIELAIVAWYQEVVCGDSRAADGNRAGRDAHDTNTELWYGVAKADDPEQFTALRKKAKNGAFASNYSASAKRLALTLNISVGEAEGILRTVSENSEIDALKEFVWQQMSRPREGVLPVRKPYGYGKANYGMLYTVFNARMFYPEINSHDKAAKAKAQRQSFNALCQGGCAALLRKLCNLSQHAFVGGKGWVAGLVHDEMIAYAKVEYTAEIQAELNKAWNSIVLPSKQGGVYVRADFHIVNDWSEKA